jgi:hypothetical protein
MKKCANKKHSPNMYLKTRTATFGVEAFVVWAIYKSLVIFLLHPERLKM